MTQQKERGFALIEVLLVLVILGIVGFTGWFVWHSKQSADATLSTAAKSQPAITKKPNASTKTDPTDAHSSSASQSTNNYFVIKEWGLKVSIGTADPSKLTYKLTGKTNTEGGNALVDGALVSLTDDVTTDEQCQLLGIVIQKSAQKYDDRAAQKQVGSFWYDVGGSPGSCNNPTLDPLRLTYVQNISKNDFSAL